MTTLERNRFIGVAFLVVAFYQLATLSLGLFGYSLTYPYMTGTTSAVATAKQAAKPDDFAATPGDTSGIPGFPGLSPNHSPTSAPTPQPTPMSKVEIEAQRTMTMIYVIGGVQFAILFFILFAGFTVVSVRAGGRSMGIVASLFLLFLYPLG